VRVGEFQRGNDKLADEAVGKIERIHSFLRQGSGERFAMDDVARQLRELVQ
jgi:type III secretion protein N (ATPase)